MKKIIKIGEKECTLEAVASLSIIMKRTFKTNIFSEFQNYDPEKPGAIDDKLELIMELAYVMNKQAETKTIKEMLNLNEENYIEWLSDFEPLDFVNAGADILNVYLCSRETETEAKNPGAPL